jgi:hypothetical protein
MIPAVKLGWLGGVLDMQGRLVYRNIGASRNTRQTTLVVQTKEQSVIKRLGEMTGTSPEYIKPVNISKYLRRGCAEHCPEKHQHINDEPEVLMPGTTRWSAGGCALVTLLYNVEELLTVDRGWADVKAEVAARTVFTGRGGITVLKRLQELRQLGWELPKVYEEALTAQWDRALESLQEAS